MVDDGGKVGNDAIDTGGVADFVVALGDDVSLSASALAGELGYAACGALASVFEELTGIDKFGNPAGVVGVAPALAGVPAAAKFADEGGAAGVKPATATAEGFD